jgi:periplasmic protein TonB
MRRGDATIQPIHLSRRAGWPAAAGFALSLTLHAILLVLATEAMLPGGTPPPLIRVSLWSGRGGSSSGGGDAIDHPPAVAGPPTLKVSHAARAKRPLQPPRTRLRSHARRGSEALRHRGPAAATDARPSLPRSVAAAPSETAGDAAADELGAHIGFGAPTAAHGARVGGAGTGAGTGRGIGLEAGDGVNQREACLYCPEPHYPLIARARGWQGTVHVGLLVQADGTVRAARLQRSSGYGVLDQAAMAVARHSRFRPPDTRGLSSPLRGRIEYRFQLSNAR